MLSEDCIILISKVKTFANIFLDNLRIKLILSLTFFATCFNLRNLTTLRVNTFHIIPPSYWVIFSYYILSKLLLNHIFSCCWFTMRIMNCTIKTFTIAILSCTFVLSTFKYTMNNLKVYMFGDFVIVALKTLHQTIRFSIKGFKIESNIHFISFYRFKGDF